MFKQDWIQTLSKCYINVKTFVCFGMQKDVVFNNNNELLIFGLEIIKPFDKKMQPQNLQTSNTLTFIVNIKLITFSFHQFQAFYGVV